MNIEAAVMDVPWGAALTQFREYQQVVTRGTATREDQTLYRALRQVVRGRKVIDLSVAVADAGYDRAGRPKLAVARADWRTVRLETRDTNGEERFWRWRFENGAHTSTRRSVRVELPVSRGWASMTHQDAQGSAISRWAVRGQALVPTVPPQHRPRGTLAGYHILFEAEWHPVPPVDPILLKHVEGSFYVVLATWDLTPLEQAVLRARL